MHESPLQADRGGCGSSRQPVDPLLPRWLPPPGQLQDPPRKSLKPSLQAGLGGGGICRQPVDFVASRLTFWGVLCHPPTFQEFSTRL